MSVSLSVDRFEGDQKEIAVLVGDDDLTLNVPRTFLPEGIRPGEVVTLAFKRDPTATKRLNAETKKLQDELDASDPGGDLKL